MKRFTEEKSKKWILLTIIISAIIIIVAMATTLFSANIQFNEDEDNSIKGRTEKGFIDYETNVLGEIIIEVFAIAAGLLLAFQSDNYLDGLKEKKDKTMTLMSIKRELVKIKTLIDAKSPLCEVEGSMVSYQSAVASGVLQKIVDTPNYEVIVGLYCPFLTTIMKTLVIDNLNNFRKNLYDDKTKPKSRLYMSAWLGQLIYVASLPIEQSANIPLNNGLRQLINIIINKCGKTGENDLKAVESGGTGRDTDIFMAVNYGYDTLTEEFSKDKEEDRLKEIIKYRESIMRGSIEYYKDNQWKRLEAVEKRDLANKVKDLRELPNKIFEYESENKSYFLKSKRKKFEKKGKYIHQYGKDAYVIIELKKNFVEKEKDLNYDVLYYFNKEKIKKLKGNEPILTVLNDKVVRWSSDI
ncbi:MAG: hypothetical protein LBT55_06245 [Clostridiaceae bacterium]|jgi:hypothetical protein|nr:hypothetical protein [Clostridiaceae bacterium]